MNSMYLNRNSSFEIMRLIAMFMIILGHCTLATAENIEPYLVGLDFVGWFIKSFTICAVNLFFLLTGYYLSSKNFRISKIAHLWGKTIFYSVFIYIIVAVISGDFEVNECIKYLMPILNKKYWFMQTYIVSAFLQPYIGLVLEKLSNKKLTFLVIVLLIFFSLHETFVKVAYTLDQTQGYGIIWACVMMVVGYWLRAYKESICGLSRYIYLIGYICLSIIIYISNYMIIKMNIAGGFVSRGNFYAYNSISVLIQSVCLFCFFIKSEKGASNRIINKLANHCIAGYLISAHPLFLTTIWTSFIKMEKYSTDIILYIFMSIIMSIIVLATCIFIDYIFEIMVAVFKIHKIDAVIDNLYIKYTE